MTINKMVSLILSASFAMLPIIAHADDMQITNTAPNYFTFSVNNSCSDKFGVVSPHASKVIPAAKLKEACKANPTNCETYLYQQQNCVGNSIARITFDINHGVTRIIMLDHEHFVIKVNNPFSFQIESRDPA